VLYKYNLKLNIVTKVNVNGFM